MKQKTSVVLTGVGGQGVITATNILGKAAIKAKIKVYASEVHGMAQRGGSVYCTVRMGDVSSPLVATGKADAIISLEPAEALRYIKYANKNTKIVVDINPVVPFTVAVGDYEYPDLKDIYNEISKFARLFKIDASKIAEDAGAIITKNIVMLGALSATRILPFDSNILLDTIIDNVPSQYQHINRKAFEGGMKAIEQKS